MEIAETKRGGPRPGAGRPMGSTSLKRRAARHTCEALAALVAVTNDGSASPDARVQAAKIILDCSIGTHQPESKP